MERRELEGREHFVVPVVMINEGVHEGSHGPLFYPADELQRTVHLWNAKPVVVYHPSMYGDGMAGQPEVFNRQKVGVLFNVRFEHKALKAEAWLDIDRLRKVDYRVLDSVQNNSMVEVSTGLITHAFEKAGVWNGEKYRGIAKNFEPDHLAILPDQIGACSIADGAGLCRNATGYMEPLVMPAMDFSKC